jgi:hypothetical protein
MKWILRSATLALALLLLVYLKDIRLRQNAVYFQTETAPNRLYSVDRYFLNTSDGSVLLRVFDAQHRLIAEKVCQRFIVNPNLLDRWDCDATHCRHYRWNSLEQDSIALPPGWIEQFKAWLP